MAWTSPKTWTTNEVLTSSDMNVYVRDNETFLRNPPQCSASNSTGQNINSSTDTILSANTELFDTDGMHSTVTNNSRITIQTAGRYRVSAHASWDASTGGSYRRLRVSINGSTLHTLDLTSLVNSSGAGTGNNGSRCFILAATDYVEIEANHNAGVTLGVTLAEFTVEWMGNT